MAQVLEFKLPDLGEGLTEAEIVRWLVEVGDVVAIDQPVVEVETAKAMVEVPCPYGGVVTARFGEEGTELPVGAPLLTVAVGSADSGAATPAKGSGTAGSGAAGSGSGAAEAESSGNVLVGYGTGAPAARRRRVRPEQVSARPATPEPAPVAEEVRGPVAVVSPLVRKLARQHDVDLRQVNGSGRDGLILRADVESAIRAVSERTAVPVAAAAPSRPRCRGRRPVPPVSGFRCVAYGARWPTSCRAAGTRSRMRRAGSTPTPPS